MIFGALSIIVKNRIREIKGRNVKKKKSQSIFLKAGGFYAISHIMKKIFLFVKFWRVSFVLSIGRWMDDVVLYGR